jgi:dTDP-4-dehydrorhamnose 3,5-epimerase
MLLEKTHLPGVLILTPRTFGDDRGFFFESFNTRVFAEITGENVQFLQDNHSKSSLGVLRGLHYQLGKPQGKLVRVIEGSIFDVAVDIRNGSPSFGEWVGVELTAENKKQLWVPPGFAHGFLVTSKSAQVLYKATDFYSPQHERSIVWNDDLIAIRWPDLCMSPTLSPKDAEAPCLDNAEIPNFKS